MGRFSRPSLLHQREIKLSQNFHPSQNCADKKRKSDCEAESIHGSGRTCKNNFHLTFFCGTLLAIEQSFSQQARPITFFNKLYSELRRVARKIKKFRESGEAGRDKREKPDEKPVTEFFLLVASVSRSAREEMAYENFE